MSTLAVFLVLGGTAAAATAIQGSRLVNHTVGGVKMINNTLTGTQIKESTLGVVPKASSVNGMRVLRASGTRAVNATFLQLFAVPGFGTVQVRCLTGGDAFEVQYVNTTSSSQHFNRQESKVGVVSVTETGGVVTSLGGTATSTVNTAQNNGGYAGRLSVIHATPTYSLELLYSGVNRADGGANCLYTVTAIFS